MSRQPNVMRGGQGKSWRGSGRGRPGQRDRPSQAQRLFGPPPGQNQGGYGPGQYGLGSGQDGSWTGHYEPGAMQYGAGSGQYGSGTGQYGSGPGQYGSGLHQYVSGQGQYGSGPGQYGSGPEQQWSGLGQYGSGSGQYGSDSGQHRSGQGQYGSGPGQYGSGPGQYGSGQGQYGSGLGQYGPGPGQYGPGPGQSGQGQYRSDHNGPGSNEYAGRRGGRGRPGNSFNRAKEFGSQSSLASEGWNSNRGRGRRGRGHNGNRDDRMNQYGSQSSLASEGGNSNRGRGKRGSGHGNRDDRMNQYGSQSSLASEGENSNRGGGGRRRGNNRSEFWNQSSLANEGGKFERGRGTSRGRRQYDYRSDKRNEFGSGNSLVSEGSSSQEVGRQDDSQTEDSDSQLSGAGGEESSKRGTGRRGGGYERRQRGRGRGQWERRGRGNNRRGRGEANGYSRGGRRSNDETARVDSSGPSDLEECGRGRSYIRRRGERQGGYRGRAGRGRTGARGGSRSHVSKEVESKEKDLTLVDLIDFEEQNYRNYTNDVVDTEGSKDTDETGSESDTSDKDVGSKKSFKPRVLSKKKHVIVGKGLSKVGKGKMAIRKNTEKRPNISSNKTKIFSSEKSQEIGDILKALENVSSKHIGEDANDGELLDLEEIRNTLQDSDDTAGGGPQAQARRRRRERRRVSNHENKPADQADAISETSEDEINAKKAFKVLLSEFGGRGTMFELLQQEPSFPPSFFDTLWLKKHRNKFMIFEKDGDIQCVSVCHPKAKLCVFFNEKKGCTNEKCGYFHVCNGFVSETCKPHIRKCPRTHNFFEGQNNHLIEQFGFEEFKNKELSKIIRRSVPEICKAYNQGVTHDEDTCPDLHLCERLMSCQQNSCKLEHRCQSTDHNRWVLACFRLTNFKPHLLLKMILGQKREDNDPQASDSIEQSSSSSGVKGPFTDFASIQGPAKVADCKMTRGVDNTKSHSPSLQLEKLAADNTHLRGDRVLQFPERIAEGPTSYMNFGAPSPANTWLQSKARAPDMTSEAGTSVDVSKSMSDIPIPPPFLSLDAGQPKQRDSFDFFVNTSPDTKELIHQRYMKTSPSVPLNPQRQRNASSTGTLLEPASLSSQLSTGNEERLPKQSSVAERIAAGQFLCEKHIWGTCTDRTSCPQYHGKYKLPYQWQVEITADSWLDLDERDNQQLERNFCGLKSFSEVAVTFGVKTTVNLDEMKADIQTRQKKVRRLSTRSYTEGSGSLVHLTFWCWHFKDIHHRWAPYEPDKTQFILEKKFQHGQASYLFARDKFHYKLSFSDMEQKNLETGKIRKVMRRPMYVSAEDATQKRALSHPCWLQQAPERNYNLPDHWTPLDILQPFELVSLDPSTGSYREVSNHFHQTLLRSRFSISCVYQVQNSSMWIKHCSQRQSMKEQGEREGRHEKVREAMLFHGTDSEEVVRGICVNGFDNRMSGKNGTVYGKGAYFALEAKYSNNYTGSSKKKYMFLAKVLVGLFTKGNSDLTRPPVRVGHVLYDSCVNDLTHPTIYVLFDLNQAYPEYLIEYDDIRPPSPPSVNRHMYGAAAASMRASATSSATGSAYASYRGAQSVATTPVSTPATANASSTSAQGGSQTRTPTSPSQPPQPSARPSANSQQQKDSKCVVM